MGATDFFQALGVLHTIFRHENPCGLAFIRTMLRMEILRHRVQKYFSRTNLVRETSIFRGGTFFDVRVFNPFASSNRTTSVPSSYQRHQVTSERNGVAMRSESVKSSMAPSAPSFSPHLEAWGSQRHRYTSALLTCYRKSARTPTPG